MKSNEPTWEYVTDKEAEHDRLYSIENRISRAEDKHNKLEDKFYLSRLIFITLLLVDVAVQLYLIIPET